MCAKMIHHAGIARVLYLEKHYASVEGVNYLIDHLGEENIHVLRSVDAKEGHARRSELP